MYLPPAFEEKDPETLWQIVRAHSLGLLISQAHSELAANLVPFEVSLASGQATLLAHLAKANPQGRDLTGQDVLVVFQGANAYVSPQWYPSKREHGKVVPTWNYAVVQVRGRARVIDDPRWLHAQVSRLTDRHEQGIATGKAWQVGDAPEDFIQSQLKGIVGLEIAVTQITGKLKTSQNRQVPDRAGVAQGLEAQGGAQNLAMAAMVAMARP
jgi:transcriptional regulator